MEAPRERFLMLVKFYSSKKHADKMLAGELRAGRLKKFRETEDPVRRDEFEGTMLWEGGTLTLRTDGGESLTVSPNDLAGPIERRSHLLDNLNVFCMTVFRSDLGPWPSWQLVDQVTQQVVESLPTCREFGVHAVVITDAKEFLKRVKRAATRENWQVRWSLVEYYDSYPPNVAFGREDTFRPAFLKRRKYQLEREFRVAMNTGTLGDNRVTLDIGDIRDIAWYTETRELRSLQSHMRGICPLCGTHPCESYRMQPGEHFGDTSSEFHELHDFSCEGCGSFSVTTTAGELPEQHGAAGISALGLIPRWHPLVERHVVDRSLVEEAMSVRTPLT